jgi:hypothetical protein
MQRARSTRPRYHPPSSRRQSRVSTPTHPPTHTAQRTTHNAHRRPVHDPEILSTITLLTPLLSTCIRIITCFACSISAWCIVRGLALRLSNVTILFCFQLLPELQRIRAHTHTEPIHCTRMPCPCTHVATTVVVLQGPPVAVVLAGCCLLLARSFDACARTHTLHVSFEHID